MKKLSWVLIVMALIIAVWAAYPWFRIMLVKYQYRDQIRVDLQKPIVPLPPKQFETWQLEVAREIDRQIEEMDKADKILRRERDQRNQQHMKEITKDLLKLYGGKKPEEKGSTHIPNQGTVIQEFDKERNVIIYRTPKPGE